MVVWEEKVPDVVWPAQSVKVKPLNQNNTAAQATFMNICMKYYQSMQQVEREGAVSDEASLCQCVVFVNIAIK